MRTSKVTIICVSMAVALISIAGCSRNGESRWYRGNMHTHSLWSDGDAAPEHVVAWYKEHGYDWLSLTDHDVLLRNERWFPITEDGRLTPSRVQSLRDEFGPDWLVTRESDGVTDMRLKTLAQLRDRFEVPGQFLLIEGEEISDESEGKPLHINVLNPADVIPTQGGANIHETIERNLSAVQRRAEQSGRHMVAQINHPYWEWALTPEHLAAAAGTQLFEVYNGHADCHNYGDSIRPGLDEVWDIANTHRLSQGDLGPLYGVANDDAHEYFDLTPTLSNPGRGWIMVRADTLTTAAILDAIRSGDFYSTTGVELTEVRKGPDEYEVEIAAAEGISYTTQFIGTRIAGGSPVESGVVLLQTTSNPAVYRYRGDELYVRARVSSSRMHAHPAAGEEAPEYAWTQPVVLSRAGH